MTLLQQTEFNAAILLFTALQDSLEGVELTGSEGVLTAVRLVNVITIYSGEKFQIIGISFIQFVEH